jgi:hypothetical protein
MNAPPTIRCECGWRHYGVCPNPLHLPQPPRRSSRGLELEVITDLERIPDGESEAHAA